MTVEAGRIHLYGLYANVQTSGSTVPYGVGSVAKPGQPSVCPVPWRAHEETAMKITNVSLRRLAPMLLVVVGAVGSQPVAAESAAMPGGQWRQTCDGRIHPRQHAVCALPAG